MDTHNGFGTTPAVDVAAYPAIKRHLDLHWAAIAKRQDKGATPYNLRNCAYHEEFNKEKVIWIELVDEGRFAYDATGVLVEATAFMMTGPDVKLLCAVLNSSLARWFLLRSAPTSGLGTLRWKKAYIEEFPVPNLGRRRRNKIAHVVDLASNTVESTEKEMMRQVDESLFQAYGLTEEESDQIRQSANRTQ